MSWMSAMWKEATGGHAGGGQHDEARDSWAKPWQETVPQPRGEGDEDRTFYDVMRDLDRQVARAQLASQFQIVSPDEAAADDLVRLRADNQVTEEELTRIAALYSDIRMGETGIQLDTGGLTGEEAMRYRAGAQQDLVSILQTRVGREVLGQLAADPEVEVKLGAAFARDGNNRPQAGLGVDRQVTAGYAFPRGGESSEIAPGVPGAGAAGVTVGYNPDTLVAHEDDPLTVGTQPYRSDVVLFHELIHAMHMKQGERLTHRATYEDSCTPGEDVESAEEVRTVGLGEYGEEPISENAYRLARRAIGNLDVGERRGDDGMPRRHRYPLAPKGRYGSNPCGHED